jgi:flagellar hook-basal body complex protein FliE
MSGSPLPVSRLVPGILEQVRPESKTKETSGEQKGNFTEMFGDLLQSVNDMHGDAAQVQEALLNGDPVELHQVMIKLEEAGIATDLLLEIRSRLLSGFSELMRMPM